MTVKETRFLSFRITPFFVALTFFLFNSCQEREFTNPFDPQVPKTLSITVLPATAGKVNVSPGGTSFKTDQVVTLIPEASQHWVFKNWEGDATGTANPLSVVMNKNKSVVAVFIRRNYPLTLTIEGEGTVGEKVVFSPSNREYPHSTIVELTPIPKQGWLFDSWSGDLSGKNVPQNITIDNPKTVRVKFVQQQISNLACASALNSGNLVATLPANGVSSAIPYTTVAGGSYVGQSVTSTGVTGLTATLLPGNFSPGSGNLTFTIAGTPSGVGTASFAISIGGQTCTFSRVVNPLGTIAGLNCGGAATNGSLFSGAAAVNVSSVVPYTGGNGSAYLGQSINSAGVTGLTATLAPGNFVSGNGTLTYTITGTPSTTGNATFALSIGGQTCSLTRVVTTLTGTISNLNCGLASASGVLNANQAATGVAGAIPYSGGNGGVHQGQSISSSGVSGLTLSLNPGTFATGNGTLEYGISGTPVGSGTASFALNIGGQTCTLTRVVNQPAGSISALNCSSVSNIGTLTQQTAATGVSSIFVYSGGNGGPYGAQTIASTGVSGLIATLTPGNFAVGSGAITYSITGTPNAAGVATFELSLGGQTCSLTRVVTTLTGSISNLNCGSASASGVLYANQAATGVAGAIPYTGGNGGIHQGQDVSSSGVSGLTLTINSGAFATGNGTLEYSISGTPVGSGTASFALNIGGQTCTLTRVVNQLVVAGIISNLACSSATITGALTQGTAAAGVSFSVPYSGGNGGTHSGQSVNSTGVQGLVATLSAGSFSGSTGSLTYTINGTPLASGTASFALNIGGRTCTLTRTVEPSATSSFPNNTVFCGGIQTAIVPVSSPSTGRTWMDRNLGASKVATSSTDTGSFGDLYQWGRRADGHQCKNSSISLALSSSDTPSNSNFIVAPNGLSDWRSPQNSTLWQGVSGTNNPCPTGYRLPTQSELNAELQSWTNKNSSGAFASPLKLPSSGFRWYDDGTLGPTSFAFYWTSQVSGNYSIPLIFNSSSAGITSAWERANGFSVRCIKD
jgi:uncharacterized protein (TIGR02145 family)